MKGIHCDAGSNSSLISLVSIAAVEVYNAAAIDRFFKSYMFIDNMRVLSYSRVFKAIGGLQRLNDIHIINNKGPVYKVYLDREISDVNLLGPDVVAFNMLKRFIRILGEPCHVKTSLFMTTPSYKSSEFNLAYKVAYIYTKALKKLTLDYFSYLYPSLDIPLNGGIPTEDHLRSLLKCRFLPYFYIESKTFLYLHKFISNNSVDKPLWYPHLYEKYSYLLPKESKSES